MNGIYFNIKQEIVPVFFTNTENKIKIFFDYGLRDEKQKGLAHMYEHLIISYLKDILSINPVIKNTTDVFSNPFVIIK